MEKVDKKTDKLPAITQCSKSILVHGNRNSVSNNQNKVDMELKRIHDIQAEYDRRTEAELEAIKLITEGRHKEAIAILAALDDDVIKKLSEGQGE